MILFVHDGIALQTRARYKRVLTKKLKCSLIKNKTHTIIFNRSPQKRWLNSNFVSKAKDESKQQKTDV